LLDSLSVDLNLVYLDDLTLGGLEEVLARDVQRSIDVGGIAMCYTSTSLSANLSLIQIVRSPMPL